MRKRNALEFVSLDGVIQSPGGSKEDTSGSFAYGGWLKPHSDAASGAAMMKQMKAPSDLLLGRKTFENFAGFWPQHGDIWPGVNIVGNLTGLRRSGPLRRSRSAVARRVTGGRVSNSGLRVNQALVRWSSISCRVSAQTQAAVRTRFSRPDGPGTIKGPFCALLK